MSNRKGEWIQTITGTQFFPMDPRPEDVKLEDIAHALSNLCRFGGHVISPYSVAQHSIHVSEHLPIELAAIGLLHDASEAYAVDIPRPIKIHLPDYKVMEERLMRAIGARFGLALEPLPPEVKVQDNRALMTEKRDLLLVPHPARWNEEPIPPWKEKIYPWNSGIAKTLFLERAKELGIK